MPERTMQFGLYGARGRKSADLAGEVLDKLAMEGGIRSPVTSRRGLGARLNYLTRSDAGRQAMAEAGITVTRRTLRNWLQHKQSPSRDNLARIDAAYRAHRRRNVAPHLLQRLNARGGTRVEIQPLDQRAVADPRKRHIATDRADFRRLRIRTWDRIVEAWAAQDEAALADAWDDQLTDLGSQWGQYEYATSVGFSA
ncbi:transcriptional regulator (plasmid) [Streptomyces sp. NBC_01795]|uniref:transcriptional regulator n=1 Tax=unclassified Streptomyces TaxID=2593676 RepID=UPI002DD81CC9|nr:MULTISPECIES: transcriptional regulator [unclassified Streptomyces]WSA97564.1 transcriptional regulator [Streptomyces sp. NBC_01795]WSB82188.1 transcriptional regulator [Streptomyces sp. NBC_01775]WSS18159.1 transcriptional regulator [Streptomyces sp. NBC_01186]